MRAMKSAFPGIMIGLFTLLLAACQTGGQTQESRPVADSSAPVQSAREAAPYTLGPSDKLRVTVFGEPELSGDFVVDGAGYVSLPLIESVDVEGLTVREFERLAEERFADGYLREPRVSAEVLNFRPFYILGEVGQPGEYPYTNGLTVMNAIATAQGFTYRANKKVVLIKSADSDKEVRVELTPALKVQPGDTIQVLERFF